MKILSIFVAFLENMNFKWQAQMFGILFSFMEGAIKVYEKYFRRGKENIFYHKALSALML